MHLHRRARLHFLVCVLAPTLCALAPRAEPAGAGAVVGSSDGESAELEERSALAGRPLAFEGFVYTPDGAPAEGAVVVTSAGGQALVGPNGYYRIEARVPPDAESVQVTAVGRNGGNLTASATVAVSSHTGSVLLDPLALVRGNTCSPSWLPTFGGQPGVNNQVNALTVFDDGGGPALYAGGSFTAAGGVLASRIARWDGTVWAAVGSGMNAGVRALTVFDDGGGPALYAGGGFTTAGGVAADHIARWDGSTWAAVGGGMNSTVSALTVFDDGGGPALYAGGDFTTAGGVAASHIARWDGTTWEPLGSGTGMVSALTVYDDGGGAALYAGGSFSTAGGVAANRIARWDGTTWSALGSGMSSFTDVVHALTVFDDGGGPALYAGGWFTTAGGIVANSIARWDGTTWSALGSGVDENINKVYALTVYDDGDGPALYAGGSFNTAGGVAARGIARWDGTTWSALGGQSGGGSVLALTVFDAGGGPALHAGRGSGEAPVHIERWDGTEWARLGSGMNSTVGALAVFDAGDGPALYAGGLFTTAGGGAASRIARWDGSAWSALGGGMTSSLSDAVWALTVFDAGDGPALYAGGYFTIAGGVAANCIARWDGTTWSDIGSGMCQWYHAVRALTVFDDGGGPALYAGGHLADWGAIARWDGTTWAGLGSGMNASAEALTVFDDGSGPALYAGGRFTSAATGVAASRIARWDGSTWSALGSGMNNRVTALTVFDDGGGPALYAGGWFTTAGGVAASHIARWDGTTWAALGSGVDHVVHALTVFDDGGGPALYAGGWFTTAGGVAASRIARWDGTTWSALGSGMNSTVSALTVFDDGGGPALYAGGEFESAFDSGDSFLAKWGCPDSSAPVLDCPAAVTVRDRFPGGPGEVVLFSVTATDDLDPAPLVSCSPPSGSLFPPGTTLVTCTATDASGNQSQCQFPVVVEPKARRESEPRQP